MIPKCPPFSFESYFSLRGAFLTFCRFKDRGGGEGLDVGSLFLYSYGNNFE